jgi:class 3 adenylate cyclase/predicted ATPase
MICSNCGAENPTGLKFCEQCATPFKKLCTQCGFENSATARFCGECATSLSAAAPELGTQPGTIPTVRLLPKEAEAAALDGERKTVTALFADIKGSTEMMRDLDPEEARAIVDPALRLMIDAVHRYDGYVVQSTGDGIFALFGAPIANEDHPQRAVHAALAARDDLRRRGDDLRKQGRAGVEIRIGINTGEVVMRSVQTGGHTEYSPVGHVINLASRMQGVAPADGIVVSEETRRLVEGYFELRSLGPTEVKGVAGPINVFEVMATGASRGHFDVAAQRGLTLFVGRERELQQIQRALGLAMDGNGQIVAVMAEAGTGKSRLFHEFKATLRFGGKVLEAYSVSHGKASAWLPVLELLRRYFVIQDGDDAARRRDKVHGTLTTLDLALDETLPYLFVLLGIQDTHDPIAQMDPQVKRQRTLDAIRSIVLRESMNQPMVVIFEDLHWIDEQTQALLDLLADSIAAAKILLLVNYRPEYSDQWNSKTYYSRIRLNPLGDANGAAMIAALLGEGVELKPLKRLVIERTGGNPFFIEEFVQALFDEGALIRNGAVKVVRSLSQLRLPTTVQGILAERIDRQPVEQKQLLQTLSVIGRESSLGLIRQMISTTHAQLEPMLADLRADEFIYVQPTATGIEYIFKHALTQEVAYNSLLIERRKQLHERAGQALESIFGEQLDDHLTQLAHHYSHSDNINKAVEYLGRAGQQALQRSAHDDPIRGLNAAIDLLQTLPDSPERLERELPLQLALGSVLSAIKGWSAPEVERAYIRARELCERLGDRPELFSVLFGLRTVYYIRGEGRMSYELSQQLLRRAQSESDPTHLLLAHTALGSACLDMGELVAAKEHKETAISLYDPTRHGPVALSTSFDLKGFVISYVAMTLWLLGYPDEALKRANEAVEFTRTLSHPLTLAGVEFFQGIVEYFRHEASAAQSSAERAIALSAEHGFTFWLALATILRGWAMAQQGQSEEGFAQMRQGLTALEATGAELWRPYYLALLAEVYGAMGQPERGLIVLAESLAVADKNAERWWEAELYRLHGHLLVRQDHSNIAKAQGCFYRAIEISRKQSAKSLELRATISLARLLVSQGRRDEARPILAEIYNWFTEGFGTADLKDAKALLDELGR